MIERLLSKLSRLASGKAQLHQAPEKPTSVLADLFTLYGVDLVVDVGANKGQSGLEYRAFGYTGRILSLGPIQNLYDILASNASGDDLWSTRQIAAGSSKHKTTIHVSGGHAGASSIRQMTSNVIDHAPDQQVVREENIQVDTLRSILDEVYPSGSRAFAKVDVQGYENEVIGGLTGAEDRIVGLQLESSLIPNYEGETLLVEMIPRIYELGFSLVSIEEAWGNPSTREIFQVNSVFFRTDRARQS